jgi:hypothetical protein
MREAWLVFVIGLAVGIPAGIAATHLFKAMLFGVNKSDPFSIAAAILALMAICVTAIVPARRATHAYASASGGNREMVEERGPGLLQLSRGTRQFRQPLEFSFRDTQTLAACNSTSQSTESDDLGAPGALGGSVAPYTQDSSSISHGAL